MKKVVAILMLFVALMGTMTKDMGIVKMAKSTYSLNDDDSDDEESKDEGNDGKEVKGKELVDVFHFHHSEFIFSTHLSITLFSSVMTGTGQIDKPYLESVSLPPELLA